MIKVVNPYFSDDVAFAAQITGAGVALKAFLESPAGAAKRIWRGGELVVAVPEIAALPNYDAGTIHAVCSAAGVVLADD